MVVSPEQLELQAEQAQVNRDSAQLFRAAGDRYLNDQRNYPAALRCYRNFLDEADPDALQVGKEDTWLLISLKRSRQVEN